MQIHKDRKGGREGSREGGKEGGRQAKYSTINTKSWKFPISIYYKSSSKQR